MENETKNPWSDMRNPLRRIINPGDGEAFRFERKVQYYTLAFLCAAAIVVMSLPSNWLNNDFIQSISNTIKNFWPKLQTESRFLDGLSPLRGTRHIIMHLFSTLTVVCVVCFYSLPKLNRLLVKEGTKLTEFHKVTCRLVIFGTLFAIYLHFFDTGFITSHTRVSRGIGRSHLIWFWTALQSTFLLIACHMVFSIYIKRKKFNGKAN